jgi:VanZ family protein
VAARKIGHFGGYAVLAALWAWALAGHVRRHLVWAGAISLAYAISDEFHQTFVDGRHGAAMDVGIDALGIVAALTLIRARYGARRRS